MQDSFNPAGSAIQDVSSRSYWLATTSLYHHDYYSDYNSHSSNRPLPAPSLPLSPRSSAGSTKSPSADYIWDGCGLYVLGDDQHRDSSPSDPGGRDQDEVKKERHGVRVKSEPLDTTFIIEAPLPPMAHCLQAPTTTACPSLRATHTTKDMKKMMGVFHLNPFIFKGGALQQEENTGLKEEPEYFQFYLDFDLESSFEQCTWSPQPEEYVNRTYQDSEELGARGHQHPSYSKQETYAYQGG